VELVDEESRRFWGGQIRARMSPRTGVELSLDIRTETNEAETLRVRSMPIQASLLLFPARGAFSPFILGGAGWYAQRFETLVGDETVLSETVRDFGWHAGFGAELRMGKHAGLHGDYRYTFLDFGGDDDDDDGGGGVIGGGLVGRLLPGYRGSMWTAGLTVYF
jgi:Outer membrane protein beta-barrel domain